MSRDIKTFKKWTANNGIYTSLNLKDLEELAELGFDEYLKKHQIVIEYNPIVIFKQGKNPEQYNISKPYYDNTLSYLILTWLRWWEENKEEVEFWEKYDKEKAEDERRGKIKVITRNQELKETIDKVKEQLKEEIKMIEEVLNTK